MKKVSLLLIFLILLPFVKAEQKEFKIIPNTVGIGLQKNYDIVDFKSSDGEDCVLYHLGNPWSTNVTGWLVVEGDLAKYFTRNDPEKVFVPSGTFRYNVSCCLLPIYACFKFPYTLTKQSFNGTVRSAFTVTNQPTLVGTGSATGSSVAYSLTINILPPDFIELKAGENKCIDFYEVGKKCFSAPWFVFSDYEETKNIEGFSLKFKYKNNLIFILCVVVGFIVLLSAFYWFWESRKHKALPKQQSQTSQ
jgi:hypothetical protein